MEEKQYKSELEKLFHEGESPSVEFEFVETDIRLKFEKMLVDIRIKKSQLSSRKNKAWKAMAQMDPNDILRATDEIENLTKAEKILKDEYQKMTGKSLD